MKVRAKAKQLLYKLVRDPEGSRSFRLPYFKTMDTRRWKGCHP